VNSEPMVENIGDGPEVYLARIDRAIAQSEPLQEWLARRIEQSQGKDLRSVEALLEALRLKHPAHRWLQDPLLSASLPLVLRVAETPNAVEFLEPWYQLLVQSKRRLGADLRRVVYPFVLFMLTLGLFFFLAAVVVPVFQEMFSDFGLLIPAPTTALFVLATFATGAPWVVIGLFLFGFAALPLLRPFWNRLLDYLEFLPFVAFFRSGSRRGVLAMARWSGTLGELLAIGVPDNQAVLTAGIASGHQNLRTRSESMAMKIQKNPETSWARQSESTSFSSVAIRAMDLRREGKNVAPLLRELADSYAIRYCQRLHRSTGWIGPVFVLLIGGMVLFMIFALFLPLTSMLISLSS